MKEWEGKSIYDLIEAQLWDDIQTEKELWVALVEVNRSHANHYYFEYKLMPVQFIPGNNISMSDYFKDIEIMFDSMLTRNGKQLSTKELKRYRTFNLKVFSSLENAEIFIVERMKEAQNNYIEKINNEFSKLYQELKVKKGFNI